MDIELDHLSVEDGLSHSTVRAIHQDAEGFLWFGTQEGLNRYDGYRFEVFKHDPDDPGSLSESEVMAIHGGRTGEVWVGTWGGGLNRLSPGATAFTRYRHDPEDAASLSSDVVEALLEDRSGTLWIGTKAGLDRLDRPADTFEHVLGLAVNALLEDRRGRLWIATEAGLYLLDRQTGAPAPYPPEPSPAGSAPASVSAIAEDTEGSLWIATAGTLRRLDPRDGTSELYRHDPSDPGSVAAGTVQRLFVDSAGDLWVAVESAGLSRLRRGGDRFLRHRREALDPRSLSGESVRAIFEDATGILWFGSYVGIDKYDRAREQFATYRQRAGRGLASDSIWAIFEDSGGLLWAGTYDRGLDRIDRARGEIVHYPPAPSDPAGLPNGTVTSIVEDAAGDLWIGTWGGLSRLVRGPGPGAGRFTTWRHDPADPESLSDPGVATLHLDSSQRLWVGTYSGLDRFDRERGRAVRYPVDPADPESLGKTPIYAVVEDREAALWFGSDRDGLYRLDPGSQRFTHYRHDPDRPGSLTSDKIATLHAGSSGELWVGTYGAGLGRRDPDRGFTHYREKDGLANDSVLGILEDGDGFLWLSTNNGLSRFDPESGTFSSYGVDDGLQGTVFSSGSSFESAGGEMFFGGIRGFNAFFPDRIADDPVPPSVVITGWRRFNRSRPLESARLEPVPAAVSGRPAELVLTHRDYALAFELAALHFKSPRQNRYAYRLEEFDPEWIRSDASRRWAQYSNLPPGRYVFRARGSNSDGVWNDEGASLRIRVLPPPWKTWWAYSLYGLTLAAALAGTQRHQQRKVAREREISRRLREVDRLKDQFLANTSHELRTPLFGITGLAESLIDGATGELSDGTKFNLSMIASSGRRLSGLVDDILDFSKLSKKSLELHRRPVDLRVLADVVLGLSRPLVGSKDLELSNAVAADLPPADADENRLQQILHNLVGNAVKFTESGSVEVSAVAEEGRLVVQVADTGAGIAHAQMERIFEAFEQVDASTVRTHGGTGLGLAVSKQLVELHGGNIWADSRVGRGSTFSFTLPAARRGAAAPPPGERSEEPRGVPALALPAVEPGDAVPEDVTTAGGSGMAPEAERRDTAPEAGRDDRAPASERGDFHLLIVDDEPVIRQVLANHLRSEGYRLQHASSGREALRQLAVGSFDLVLLDVMMPQMSGYEVCRELRRTHPRDELPVIFLTAKSQVSDRVAGFASGANDYLAKPIAKAELLARVAAHLELRDAHRKLDRLLAEMTARTVELKAANAELARFTYTVSHDLKSPLVTINGFLGLLERDAERGDVERLGHDIRRIRSATERMRQLLDDLLALSRVGRQKRPAEEVALEELACEAVGLVAGEIAERGVDVEVAPGLPVVTGDRLRLLEVFQNLLQNAAKYMGEQSAPEVLIGSRDGEDGPGGGAPVVFVRDNGIGIDERYHQKVFGLFERLDAGSEGTGVGLALVKRIVEVHGGRVWVESEGSGRGSTFCFTLPG